MSKAHYKAVSRTEFSVALPLTPEHISTLRSLGSGDCVPTVVTPVLYGSALHEMCQMGLTAPYMGIWQITETGKQLYAHLNSQHA